MSLPVAHASFVPRAPLSLEKPTLFPLYFYFTRCKIRRLAEAILLAEDGARGSLALYHGLTVGAYHNGTRRVSNLPHLSGTGLALTAWQKTGGTSSRYPHFGYAATREKGASTWPAFLLSTVDMPTTKCQTNNQRMVALLPTIHSLGSIIINPLVLVCFHPLISSPQPPASQFACYYLFGTFRPQHKIWGP